MQTIYVGAIVSLLSGSRGIVTQITKGGIYERQLKVLPEYRCAEDHPRFMQPLTVPANEVMVEEDQIFNGVTIPRVSKELSCLGDVCMMFGASVVPRVWGTSKRKNMVKGWYCFGIIGTQVQCANVFLKMAQSEHAAEWERVVQTIQHEDLQSGEILYYFPGYRFF